MADAIDRLMGPLAAQLPNNMRVRTPIDFVAGDLVLWGSAPHEEGLLEAAYVWVEISRGLVAVILLHEGELTVFTEPNNNTLWTGEFRDAIWALVMRPKDRGLPDGLTWFHDGELQDAANAP